MSDRIVSSWNELTDAVFEGSLNQRLQRYRSDLVFRGVADARWGLDTSLMRLGGIYPRLEGSIFRSFRKYAHRGTIDTDSDWKWLTLAQHHGLPTRLLDWTFSPYVAMHFATAEITHMNVDAAIWCVNFSYAVEHLPGLLRRLLDEEYTKVFTVELLDKVAPKLPMFDQLGEQRPFVLFFEPPSMDDRIVNQYALLSVMPGPSELLKDWLEELPTCLVESSFHPA